MRLFLLLVVLALLAPACAQAPPEPGTWGYSLPARQLARVAYDEGPYGRNAIVCLPTTAGGGLAAVVSAPILVIAYVIVVPIDLAAYGMGLTDDEDGAWPLMGVLTDVGWLAADVVGFVTGTPFLPFSYIADESRSCAPADGPHEPQ